MTPHAQEPTPVHSIRIGQHGQRGALWYVYAGWPVGAHRRRPFYTCVTCDGICVRDTVNTDFMEGVLPVSSTGFVPGSIYGSTFTLSNSQYGVCRAPLVQFCRAPTGTPLNFVRLRMFWNSRHRSSKDRSWNMR